MTADELRERVEEIADKASNFAEYAVTPMPDDIAFPALKNGILAVRDDLVKLIEDAGGQRPWWADLQP
jgi:hypothetical protein